MKGRWTTMPLLDLKIETVDRPLKNILAHYAIILLAGFILSTFLSSYLWAEKISFLHTMVELSCVYIALSSFLIIWHTYDRNPPVYRVMCFGFLIVAIFDLLHIYYFPALNLYPRGYYDLSVWYWILGRMTEAAVLLLFSSNKLIKTSINRWAGLAASTLPAAGLSVAVVLANGRMPVLLTVEGLTPLKIAMEYAVIGLFLISAVRIKGRLKSRGILTYRYIFLALLLAIPAELFFTLFITITSPYNAFGHVLKLISYYYLYLGVFVSAINYPHEKLERAEKYLADILNGLPIGLTTLDSNYRLSFINRKARDLSGYEEREVIGSTVEEMVARFYIGTDIERVVSKLKSPAGTKNNSVKSIRTKNAEIKLKISIQGLEGGGTLVIFDDAKKDQELEDLQIQTKTILDSLNNIVVVADKSSRIVMCNKAFERAFEMSAESVLGRSLGDFFRLIRCKSGAGTFYAEGLEQISHPVEAVYVTKGGRSRYFVIQWTTILNLDGEVTGRIVVASDVSLLKKEQQRMLQREKLAMLGEMAAGVVHEIKNPLTTIKGFSQVIALKTVDPAVKRYAGMIENTANDVNRVVSDFLSFARPRAPLLKEESINSLVLSLRPVLESHLLSGGIEARFNLSDDEKAVLADGSQIKQMLMNIIKNSVEAMHDTANPLLTISTGLSEAGDEMTLTVSDNGKGMTTEEISKLGTPFFTAKDTGTGLGLSICYQTVSEHGGRINVESTPGLGTSFVIHLPCASRHSGIVRPAPVPCITQPEGLGITSRKQDCCGV